MPLQSVRAVSVDTLVRRARDGERAAYRELARRIRKTAHLRRFAASSRRALQRVGTPAALRLLATLDLLPDD
jgi:hypothetical protein